MDTNERLTQIEERLSRIEAQLASMGSPADLSVDIQRALVLSLTATSSKSATSENKAVNEAGVSTYSVLNPPDRFIRIGNQNIPAYD